MDIVTLKSQIMKNELDNLYVFTGDEIGLMNFYLSKMCSSAKRVDSVASVWKKLTTRGLNKTKPFYIVRDDKEFIQAEKVWRTAGKQIKYGTLVLLCTNLDKRSRFYKAMEEHIVTFEKMTMNQLINFVISSFPYKISENDAEYLCEACNNDYTQITNEIDKLKRVWEDMEEHFTFKAAVDYLVRAPKYADTFSMANNVLSYKVKKAIRQMQYLIDSGESGLGMITVLYNNFRNAVQVFSTDKPAKEVSEQYGIHIAAVSNLINNFQYSFDGAIKAMQILQDAEAGIKSGKYAEDKAPMIALCKIINLE